MYSRPAKILQIAAGGAAPFIKVDESHANGALENCTHDYPVKTILALSGGAGDA